MLVRKARSLEPPEASPKSRPSGQGVAHGKQKGTFAQVMESRGCQSCQILLDMQRSSETMFLQVINSVPKSSLQVIASTLNCIQELTDNQCISQSNGVTWMCIYNYKCHCILDQVQFASGLQGKSMKIVLQSSREEMTKA